MYSLHFFKQMHHSISQILVVVIVVSATASIRVIAQPSSFSPHPGDFAPHPIVHPNPNDSPEAELAWWCDSLESKISSSWSNKDLSKLQPTSCVCTFTLEGAGKLSNIKLITSSGSPKIDQSFLEAIEKASPVLEQDLALHRTIEVKSTYAQDYRIRCRLLPEIQKDSQP